MFEWIAEMCSDVLNITSKWWLEKITRHSEKNHPDWFREEDSE